MLRLRTLLFSTLLIAPGISLAQAPAQSDRALWRFIDPSFKAVIGVDVARIRQSRTGAILREKWLRPETAPHFPAFELLDDIDRGLISSPGKGLPGFGDSEGFNDSLIVMAFQGRFDPPKVRQLLTQMGAKPQSYNSFQVWRPKSQAGKDMAFVLVDATTFLFGDAKSIFAALDRAQFPSSSPPEGTLLARAAEMEANYDIWVISDVSEIMSNDQVAGMLPAGAEWASDAQNFEAGINLHSGVAADFLVRFASEASAKRVMAELMRVMNLAAKDKNAGQMQTLAKHLKFSQEGPAFRASLKLTQQELDKSMQAFEAGRKAGAQLRGTTASVATPAPIPMPVRPQAAPAEPPKPAVIRIEGLDDGPREVPINPSH